MEENITFLAVGCDLRQESFSFLDTTSCYHPHFLLIYSVGRDGRMLIEIAGQMYSSNYF